MRRKSWRTHGTVTDETATVDGPFCVAGRLGMNLFEWALFFFLPPIGVIGPRWTAAF